MKNKSKDKWYIIYAKTMEVKKEWMDAFHRERIRVHEDHDKGKCVSYPLHIHVYMYEEPKYSRGTCTYSLRYML